MTQTEQQTILNGISFIIKQAQELQEVLRKLEVTPEVNIKEIRSLDFIIDTFRISGAGFAPHNESGVRVTHKLTGISVSSSDQRSQHANRNYAWDKLIEILMQQGWEDKNVSNSGSSR